MELRLSRCRRHQELSLTLLLASGALFLALSAVAGADNRGYRHISSHRTETRTSSSSSVVQGGRVTRRLADNNSSLSRRGSITHHPPSVKNEVSTTTTTTPSSTRWARRRVRNNGKNITVTTSKSTDKNGESSDQDDALLLSSAGNGKIDNSDTGSASDDDKKTLSQQVKEGKYGLIQNEIQTERPIRPGIISYSDNNEVPKDNIRTLGGLDEEEIWLSENHVLVLKGGGFPENGDNHPSKASSLDSDDGRDWLPIDNYEAPRRQVKIPPTPDVPPPFPIQLGDDMPVQLLGVNMSEHNGTGLDVIPGGFRGFLPGEGPFFPSQYNITENLTFYNASDPPEGPLGPFYPALPPGAVIVPPPRNLTDYDDEDQSMYYPPSYSFVYHQDNSTDVPPGPLVPGIILPPPPDFFSPLEGKQNKSRVIPTSSSILKQNYQVSSRKPSVKHFKATSSKPYIRSKVKNTTSFSQYQTEDYERLSERTTTESTISETTTQSTTRSLLSPTNSININSNSLPFVEVTSAIPKNYHVKPLLANQVIDDNSNVVLDNSKNRWASASTVSSKPVPLVQYFATTPSSVDQPVEATPSSIKQVLTTENPTPRVPSQASYYFYEETGDLVNKPTPKPLLLFKTTTQPTPFKIEALPNLSNDKKNFYNLELNVPTKETIKDVFRYNIKGHQSSRLLGSDPVFFESSATPTRPSSKLSYFTTQRSNIRSNIDPPITFEYRTSSKSKPIYQYSFEATNYAGRAQKALQLPEITMPSQRPKELISNEFPEIQPISNHHYDYDGLLDNHHHLKSDPYVQPPKKKERHYLSSSTTPQPVRDTTLASHQLYFTKQDEQLLDDVTKEYFTMFGKKLSNNNNKLPSTTPIYGKSSTSTEKPKYSRPINPFRPSSIKIEYSDAITSRPYNHATNFKHPIHAIDPNADFITIVNNGHGLGQQYKPKLQPIRDYSHNPYQNFQSLRNFGNQRISQQQIHREISDQLGYSRLPQHSRLLDTHQDKANYFAYRLPGDGGHFYFLTPQAIGRDDPFVFSRPRLLRKRQEVLDN